MISNASQLKISHLVYQQIAMNRRQREVAHAKWAETLGNYSRMNLHKIVSK